MSLRTRVNGFTAWINLRLREYNASLSNVMLDLMTGTNLKTLVESMTGREISNVQSFDGGVKRWSYPGAVSVDCFQHNFQHH